MKNSKRELFRGEVLKRNGGVCCVPSCTSTAVDAHHILNRNLFVEASELGGYSPNNGAQLCSSHHYDAEATKISPKELWAWCGVTPLLPEAFSKEKDYDTWGNEILEFGKRIPGPLFEDEGFQKILKIEKLRWLFY